MEEERTLCACCGEPIFNDYYSTVGDEPVCDSCAENACIRCECCGELIYDVDVYGQDYDRCLCESCFDEAYAHCDECDDLVHRDDLHEYDGGYYLSRCYHEKNHIIRNYSYKPKPLFYGKGSRFLGVELEIDRDGRDTDNAQELLDIANHGKEKRLYIKSDSSLDEGLELFTHPMSLDYHLHEFNWEDILKTAIHQGYRSHQTSTCGLHVHVNRDAFGDTEEEQEDVISRILYFVEHHWNELVKFSRRTFGNRRFGWSLSDTTGWDYDEYLTDDEFVELDEGQVNTKNFSENVNRHYYALAFGKHDTLYAFCQKVREGFNDIELDMNAYMYRDFLYNEEEISTKNKKGDIIESEEYLSEKPPVINILDNNGNVISTDNLNLAENEQAEDNEENDDDLFGGGENNSSSSSVPALQNLEYCDSCSEFFSEEPYYKNYTYVFRNTVPYQGTLDSKVTLQLENSDIYDLDIDNKAVYVYIQGDNSDFIVN